MPHLTPPSFFAATALALTLAFSDAAAQGGAVADAGFSYRTIDRLPGRPPFRIGRGSVKLADGSTLYGNLRQQARRAPDIFIRDTVNGRSQVLPADKIAAFSIEGHSFVPLKDAFPGGLGFAASGVGAGWAEVLVMDDAGTLRLFEIHGSRHLYICHNMRSNTVTAIPAELPPRGFDPDFEAALRTLFADRPDLLHFIEGHHLTAYNLPAALHAYNSGGKMQF